MFFITPESIRFYSTAKLFLNIQTTAILIFADNFIVLLVMPTYTAQKRKIWCMGAFKNIFNCYLTKRNRKNPKPIISIYFSHFLSCDT